MSVKYLNIYITQANENSINHFPNATELTIKRSCQIFDHLLIQELNLIVPLLGMQQSQLTGYQSDRVPVRDGTGTGDRPVRSGPVPVWISYRPVCRSTGHDR
jgi:hypothetical protein